MTINVHIERLILDGVELPEEGRPALEAALVAELQMLLAAEGLSARGRRPGHISRVPGGEVALAGDGEPAGLGRQIARAVYRGMNR